MNGTALTKTKRKLNANYRAELDTLLSAMGECEARMEANHATADRLEAETERIKAETKVISVRIDAKLVDLKEQVRLLSRAK